MVHLAFGRLWLERLGKHVVDLRCFLGSQIFKRAEVKLTNEWIGFLQNMLQRIKLDPVFYQ